MIDLRFRVVDAGKAAPLFQSRNVARLIDAATGQAFLVPNPPKTGPLRTTRPPIVGRVYFIFFGNGDRKLKHGDKLTVAIGDFRAPDLILE